MDEREIVIRLIKVGNLYIESFQKSDGLYGPYAGTDGKEINVTLTNDIAQALIFDGDHMSIADALRAQVSGKIIGYRIDKYYTDK